MSPACMQKRFNLFIDRTHLKTNRQILTENCSFPTPQRLNLHDLVAETSPQRQLQQIR